MGILDRLATNRPEPAAFSSQGAPALDQTFATKAFGKFLATLAVRESPVIVDLGPVVGSNVTFLGEHLGCKIFVDDLFADIDRHAREQKVDALPGFFQGRLRQLDASVDGVLCWDLFDYLDRRSAQKLAEELTRVLRPDGVLLAFFAIGQSTDERHTKYIIVDSTTLKYRSCPATRGRQAAHLNRDIIRLFPDLRVSDSVLLKNNLREILFRKPAYLTK